MKISLKLEIGNGTISAENVDVESALAELLKLKNKILLDRILDEEWARDPSEHNDNAEVVIKNGNNTWKEDTNPFDVLSTKVSDIDTSLSVLAKRLNTIADMVSRLGDTTRPAEAVDTNTIGVLTTRINSLEGRIHTIGDMVNQIASYPAERHGDNALALKITGVEDKFLVLQDRIDRIGDMVNRQHGDELFIAELREQASEAISALSVRISEMDNRLQIIDGRLNIMASSPHSESVISDMADRMLQMSAQSSIQAQLIAGIKEQIKTGVNPQDLNKLANECVALIEPVLMTKLNSIQEELRDQAQGQMNEIEAIKQRLLNTGVPSPDFDKLVEKCVETLAPQITEQVRVLQENLVAKEGLRESRLTAFERNTTDEIRRIVDRLDSHAQNWAQMRGEINKMSDTVDDIKKNQIGLTHSVGAMEHNNDVLGKDINSRLDRVLNDGLSKIDSVAGVVDSLVHTVNELKSGLGVV